MPHFGVMLFRPWIAMALGVLLGLSGCSDVGEPAAKKSATHAPALNLVETGSFDLGKDIGPVASGSGQLVFPAGLGWGEVHAVSIDHPDEIRTVARSAYRSGLINWVAVGDDGWIYYVDQSAKQGNSDPNVLWRIYALPPGSEKPQLLESNGETPDAFVPIVRASGSHATWTMAEADRSARVRIWSPGWPGPQDVLRHADMTPGSESVVGDSMIYLGAAADGDGSHTIGGDCWSVPIRGGTPVPLTHTALAMDCVAEGSWLAWTQHIGPKDTVPESGMLDNPFGLWAKPLAGGNETKISEGYFSAWPPYVGGGLVFWAESDDVRSVCRLTDRSCQVFPSAGFHQVGVASPAGVLFIDRQDDSWVAHVMSGGGTDDDAVVRPTT